MYDALYTIYQECLPQYAVHQSLFEQHMQPVSARIITHTHRNKVVGYAMIHDASIALLCVQPCYQGQGIGSTLLAQAEQYILRSGARKIVLGRGRHYLLQGVPDEGDRIAFFQSKGYSATWCSANMTFSLMDDYFMDSVFPLQDAVTFEMLDDWRNESFLSVVNQVQPSWIPVYQTCTDPVMVAKMNENIVGFQVLSPEGGRFNVGSGKVGAIGCVGMVPSMQRRGIGRHLIMAGAQWLKAQGCGRIELRYVRIVDWYRRMGFEVTGWQWMGERDVMDDPRVSQRIYGDLS